MKQMQAEHREWLSRNFPNQPLTDPAAGLVEEAGELLHAVLKHQQHLTWGAEQRYNGVDWRAKLEDAIGDCAIFVCSFCNAANKSFAALVDASHPAALDGAMRTSLRVVELAVAFNECYCESTLIEYISYLKGLAEMHQLDFREAVLRTWAVVKERKR